MESEELKRQIEDLRSDISQYRIRLENIEKKSKDIEKLSECIAKFNKNLDHLVDSIYEDNKNALKKKGYKDSNFSKYYLSNISQILNDGNLSSVKDELARHHSQAKEKMQEVEIEKRNLNKVVEQATMQIETLKNRLFDLFGIKE